MHNNKNRQSDLKVDKDFHSTKKNQNLKDYHFDTFRNKV